VYNTQNKKTYFAIQYCITLDQLVFYLVIIKNKKNINKFYSCWILLNDLFRYK
jgi:hypothetical protein